MTQKRKQVVLGVAAVLMAGLAYLIYQHLNYVSTDNAQIGAHLTMLSSRINGTIQKVLIEENQKVKAGQVLAQIDQQDYSNASTSAEAQLTGLKARLTEAELAYKRSGDLIKKQAITQEKYDQALASYRDLLARVKASQAQLEQANLNVSYTSIIAPSDGTIARKSVEPGQYVPAGQALFAFVADGDRWVTANLKETELDGVKIGSPARVKVDSISSKVFEGKVESISPSTGAVFSLLPPDNATGNFTKVVQRVPVRIRLEKLSLEDQVELRAGLSADVAIRIR